MGGFCNLLPVFLMLPSLVWIFLDKSVWTWDQSWYGEVSVNLWYVLIHNTRAWPELMLSAFGSKAPAIAWIGQFFVPLGQAIGNIEFSLLLLTVLCNLGTILLIFKIGRKISQDSILIPFIACVFAASAPLFAGLSHQYFVEPIQAFAITLFFRIAVYTDEWEKWKTFSWLLGATGLALMAKITSPIYCFLPGCLILFHLFKKRKSQTKKAGNLKKSIGIFAGFFVLITASAWYAYNFNKILEFARQSSAGSVALYYGHKGAFFNKLLYWISASGVNLSVFIICIPVFLFIFISGCKVSYDFFKGKRDNINILGVFSFIHILGVISLFSLNINEEPRYLLPLLPAFAFLLLLGLSNINIKSLRLIFLGIFALQFIWIYSQALGIMPLKPGLSIWLKACNTSDAQKKELERLVTATQTKESWGKYNICGVEFPWLNFNNLLFYGAKDMLKTNLRAQYLSLGFAQKDFNAAIKRINDLNIVYFISVKENFMPDPPDFLNMVSKPVLKWVEKNKKFEQISFDSNQGVVIFHRIP